jgi:3-carboxy-cis,cis-muconate cycloisomerase
VKHLTALVEKAAPEAAGYVHWGATSQDVIDTGAILQLREALIVIQEDLERARDLSAGMAQKYRSTPIAGRTLLQQASPTTLGMKIAGWLDALNRHHERLTQMRKRVLVLQFGGAVGTLAALGNDSAGIAMLLAKELQLELPDIPWHGHRDRIAETGATLGFLAGTLGKIAKDVALQMQTEVGEMHESAAVAHGGSSTLPQKRNPVAATAILSAADRVPGLVSSLLTTMPQEHERGVGGWHAEWETLPEILSLTGGALHHFANMLSSLEIDAVRISQNLDMTHGLIFAEAVAMRLSKTLGRAQAHEKIRAVAVRARTEQRHLRDILLEDPTISLELSAAELDGLFDAQNYLGAAGDFIDRVTSTYSASLPNIVRRK